VIELFSRTRPDHFKSIGIHSLPGHVRKMEKDLLRATAAANGDGEAVETNLAEAGEVLAGNALFRALVVQRSRAYVRQSQLQQGKSAALFPTREELSEGLNLQDATRLINYDLHWNPVRLMQRIGRVDRRLNPEVEKRLLADHPEQAPLRGTAAYWNFLPPDELNALLTLYARVTHKTLRISKTFGIEGQKLLRPEDDYEALKDFNHQYEGTPTPAEQMQLEFERLLVADPGLEERLAGMPGRVFSGKRHPTEGARAVFFCFALPAADGGSGRRRPAGRRGICTTWRRGRCWKSRRRSWRRSVAGPTRRGTARWRRKRWRRCVPRWSDTSGIRT
jgi:superfamily II DNA/RNA helicase